MKAYELIRPDGTGSGVWACGECHRTYSVGENLGAAEVAMTAAASPMVYSPELQRGPRNCQWCGNSTEQKTDLTLEHYLEIDRASERGREFYKGKMFPLRPVSLSHSKIVGNVSSSLHEKLGGQTCEVVSSVRLQVTSRGFYAYPDLMVYSGQPESGDWYDELTDATIIIEVMSPATENYDRGFKFEQYRRLGSFKDYLVIAEDRIYLEHHTLQRDGSWTLEEISDRRKVVSLAAINCEFQVAEAYEDVEFPGEHEWSNE